MSATPPAPTRRGSCPGAPQTRGRHVSRVNGQVPATLTLDPYQTPAPTRRGSCPGAPQKKGPVSRPGSGNLSCARKLFK